MALKDQHIVKDEPTRELFIAKVRALDLEKDWLFQWGIHRKHRSLDQNSLFHMWCDEVSRATGDTKEQVKRGFKVLFIPLLPVTFRGKSELYRKGTSELDTKEMADFMDQVQADALTMGIPLTNPLEMHKR